MVGRWGFGDGKIENVGGGDCEWWMAGGGKDMGVRKGNNRGLD